MNFSYQDLSNFTQTIFLKMGCSPAEAALATKNLLAADLRGVDSHGVARLSGYVRLWEAGRINMQPQIRVVHQTPSTATLDADAALGLVAATKAMEIAIEKAQNVGSAWVAVRNSNHFGIAGQHALMAVEKDMIGIAMTNASPLVAPTFSVERLLGTNPIAVAIPAQKEFPFVADFATTTAANGKLEILQRKNLPTPTSWVQTADGQASQDAHELKKGGALLPLGGDILHGGHKGYCLGAVVDILSGVLSGAAYGPWAPPFVSFLPMPSQKVGEGLGHFFGAMRVDAFRPKEEFFEHIDQWIARFRNAKAVEGERVLIPGEPERLAQEQRLRQGIDLLAPVVQDLEDLAQKFQVPFSF